MSKKRKIVVYILLAFIFGTAMLFTILNFRECSAYANTLKISNSADPLFSEWKKFMIKFAIYGIIGIFTLLADLAAMVLIAIKDFPMFKPFVEKFQAKSQARRQAKEQTKAARTEANRQARIEQLENELNELRKD